VLWPEHLPALRLFRAVEPQFRWHEGAPTGLDYPSVRAHPATWAIPEEQREQVLADVAVMERPWIAATVAEIVRKRRERSGP